MKKITLTILSLLLLLPAFASEPNLPYLIDTVISWQYLDEKEQACLSAIYTGAVSHKQEIQLPEEITEETLSKLMELLFTDFPELLSVERRYSYIGNRNTGRVVAVKPEYSMSRTKERELQREMFEAAVEIVEAAPADEYHSELYFHDTLCDLVTYSASTEASLIHTAYGALVNGDAVCDGYSKAMALLCRLKGIRCSVISGMSYNGDTAGFHAWNIMQIKGVYTLTDITWDDVKEYMRYDYLNVTDKEMNIDHRTMYGHIWPACTSYKVNWHKLNSLHISKSTDRQLQKLVDSYARFTAETDYTISLRFEDYETYKRFTENFTSWFTASLQKYGYSMRYWVSENERQQCFSIRKLSNSVDSTADGNL